MSRRRRAALLLGLALVLGALAASDVARREAALRDQVGPAVDVLVARASLAAGRRVQAGDLAVRRVPERFAPSGPAVPELLVGRRLAVAVPAGAPVAEHLLEQPAVAGPLVGRRERAAEVVARASPELVVAGARVDVVVTRERLTELTLEDVEVLGARPVPSGEGDGAGAQVSATLRVTVRQAVYLAAAASYAAEVRLLVRAPGDRLPTGRPAVGPDLILRGRGS
jgi:pilus assembly protein CpaB